MFIAFLIQLQTNVGGIGGFRGRVKRTMTPKMLQVALCFALHTQCIINVCSKSNEIYTNYMHCQGVFMSKKWWLLRLRPGLALPPRSPPLFSGLSPSCPCLRAPIQRTVSLSLHTSYSVNTVCKRRSVTQSLCFNLRKTINCKLWLQFLWQL